MQLTAPIIGGRSSLEVLLFLLLAQELWTGSAPCMEGTAISVWMYVCMYCKSLWTVLLSKGHWFESPHLHFKLFFGKILNPKLLLMWFLLTKSCLSCYFFTSCWKCFVQFLPYCTLHVPLTGEWEEVGCLYVGTAAVRLSSSLHTAES